jgi:hypothetical protein
MIDGPALLSDLKQQVTALERHLRPLSESAEPWLKSERQASQEVGHTAGTVDRWLHERQADLAVSWVLGTVFLRFCEDNGLVESPFLAGPQAGPAQERQASYFWNHPGATDSDWILAGFTNMSKSPVIGEAFDDQHGPLFSAEIPADAAKQIISFWRRRREDGVLVHDFTDPELDTSFLVGLYEDLSESAKKAYSLVPTPSFVVDFILDQTLEPAVEEFGMFGLRLIDPVCGSGQFLLSAFHRLLAKWQDAEPTTDRLTLIRRSLSSIHGVDKSASAVAITRFRLLVAVIKAGGRDAFRQIIPAFPLIIANGDSLLEGRGAPGSRSNLFSDTDSHLRVGEALGRYATAGIDLLGAGSYDIVVGNPPYVTVKDKRQDETYRIAYRDVCTGRYALTVPFARRFFDLARSGEVNKRKAGYVGQLTANSFMKREFGRKLIEEFFSDHITLTRIIDTSGAYIPGHGSPTVILVGRNRPADVVDQVFVVVGRRGEPEVPTDPARGLVWQSILRHAAHVGQADEWTQSLSLDRELLRSFPWNLADHDTQAILRSMSSHRPLGDRVARIGYFANTGSDDLFTAVPASFRRAQAEDDQLLVPIITGSEVRDWLAVPQREAFFPRDGRLQPIDIKESSRQLKRLWPYRTILGMRRNYSGRSYFADGRTWYDWHQIANLSSTHQWMITFSWVSTHNHFAILRDHIVPLPSAPVVQFLKGTSELSLIHWVAFLNSSAVCFWLKQHSNSKGRPTVDQTGTGEPWTEYYEFTPARVGELPFPKDPRTNYAVELNQLARELAKTEPAAVIAANHPSRQILAAARGRWEELRARMISLQEELDWEVYRSYGLLANSDGLIAPRNSVPHLSLGERAFEISLARELAAGLEKSTWFVRHRSSPIVELPQHWPTDYKTVIQRRIDAINRNKNIQFLERPEFKRRWASQSWDVRQASALCAWLLDRCESRDLWYEHRNGVLSPRPLTVIQMADYFRSDSAAVEAAKIYAPDKNLQEVLQDIIADQHVPYLAALRLRDSGMRKHAEWEYVWQLQREQDSLTDSKAIGIQPNIPTPPRYSSADFLRVEYWRQRGKYDFPNERFISYPLTSSAVGQPRVLGWAGWNHYEQAQVLAALVEERANVDSWEPEQLVPLLAGLAEILPWVKQWHREVDPVYGQSPADVIMGYLQSQQVRYGLSEKILRSWRPARSKRGRPRKDA